MLRKEEGKGNCHLGSMSPILVTLWQFFFSFPESKEHQRFSAVNFFFLIKKQKHRPLVLGVVPFCFEAGSDLTFRGLLKSPPMI